MKAYRDLLHLAVAAAGRGASHVRAARRPERASWALKAGRPSDFVTAVDRDAEREIVDALTRGTPKAVVLGEELSPDAARAELLWVVDPLDGTTNYLHGYPAYAVSVAAIVEGRLAVGVVLDIVRDVTYHAVAGGGAWCGERRLAVSTVAEPGSALVGTGFPFKVPHLLPAYLRHFTAILTASAGIRRAGAASLDFVDIALGRFDGFWEPYLAPWDVAAGALIVREAGGVVSDPAGNDDDVLRHGAFVAGNPAIHRWLLEVLAG